MVSVLLSASVERCFVSRTRDKKEEEDLLGKEAVIRKKKKSACHLSNGPDCNKGSNMVELAYWGTSVERIATKSIFSRIQI